LIVEALRSDDACALTSGVFGLDLHSRDRLLDWGQMRVVLQAYRERRAGLCALALEPLVDCAVKSGGLDRDVETAPIGGRNLALNALERIERPSIIAVD
jgi:hypothetical protein